MAKSGAVQVRTAAFLRRGIWELRQRQCRPASATLLLLALLSVLILGLFVAPDAQLSPLSALTNLRGRLATNRGANALRWGVGNNVVHLNGQRIQRPLRSQYPNGDANKFQCDLPSLRFQCEMDGNEGCRAYPQLFPSSALFENWSPAHTARSPSGIFDSICHFNLSSPYEFRLAQMFREMEVPFVVYGIPELSSASERWTDEYLASQLTPEALYKVHVANNSHFMYYRKSEQLQEETAPYESRWMTYPRFVEAVHNVKPLEEAGEPHEYYYLMLKKNDFLGKAGFIYEELEFLNPLQTVRDPRFGDLFVRDTKIAADRGMRCRLGMQGIIAEGHVDGGLNWISMIRGTKRYVVSPPSACKCLGLLTTGQSARHTSLNWSDISALPESARNCPAAEVALTAGEVLYLPSFWYHHIVSLDTSIQCNLRSGFTIRPDTQKFLENCGFGKKK